MVKVKINDRAALERAYPPDQFAADSAENSATANEAVAGVRVLSAPDSNGEFSLERGRRQVGEAASAVFLVPYRPGGNAGEPEAASGDQQAGYHAFLDDIVAAARRFGFRPEASPGQGDPRIRGLRQ
jgi:hypothetical protein